MSIKINWTKITMLYWWLVKRHFTLFRYINTVYHIQNHTGLVCSAFWLHFLFLAVSCDPLQYSSVGEKTRLSKLELRLSHFSWLTHICLDNLNTIGSGNGLSLGRYKDIIWTNTVTLSIWPLGKNFHEFLIEIHISSRKSISKFYLENDGDVASASMC